MTALAEYLLKANLCLAGFYALYYLLLRRHTFFGLNRAYLLVALVASFILPLISLPEPVVETVSLPIISLPVTVTATQPTGPTLEDGLLVAYGAGAVLFLSLLVISLWRLRQLIHSGQATRQTGHTLVLLDDERVAPFSFFRYLVLNRADFDQHADPIVRHELAHIQQGHSVDVLLAELVKVVCWPNPVAWLYKRSLQQIHEYLADQQATDKAQYARFLFDYAFEGTPSPVTNSFFTPALLTQRIRMLYQSRNTGRVLWKYALVLPLLAILVGLTAAREPIMDTLMSQPKGGITVSGRVVDAKGKPLAGASVMDGYQMTKTDSRGYYKIVNVVVPAKVMFGHVGFQHVLRSINRAETVNMTLRRTREELPLMGATANYRAVGVNKAMPVSADPPDSQTINNEVFTVVEQNPIFPDGIPGLMYYVAHNLRYPAPAQKAKIQGTVFVKFIVSATGEVREAKVTKGIGHGCDQEAVRVVSQMPTWTPGKQYGKPVSVAYVLPIQFALEKQEDKRTGQIEKRTSLTDVNAVFQPIDTLPARPIIDMSSRTLTVRHSDSMAEKPLFVMDGKELPEDYDLNKLNPDNIQSMTVLKGTSAQATYGEKGKNGVIEITTKTKKP